MRALLLAVPITLACATNAPLTGTSAAVHTGLAAGLAAAERSAGGCWALCTHGTVCNPRTGFCEAAGTIPDLALAACLPGETCPHPGHEPVVSQKRPLGARQPNEVLPGVGVAPTSGTEPPFPPAKSLTPQ